MATVAAPLPIDLDHHESVSKRSLSVAGMSTIIEWYDFTLYLYLATVITRVFSDGSAGGRAATFLLFAVTYLLRPVGAAFFGSLGDRIGRRPVLLISMALMTVAMLATALLPTYSAIGSSAWWLLFGLRGLMSFSVGGEYSGVITYLVEGSEPENRGFVTSLASASSEIGALIAVGIAAATTTVLSSTQVDSWGWRIPFFVGALMAGATLLMRSQMEESPVFESEDPAERAKNPLFSVLREEPAAVARGFAISALGSITYYVGIGYAPTFLNAVGKFSEKDSLWLSTAAAIAVIVITPIAGALGDRFGRRPVLLIFAALAAISSLTMFELMSRGTAGVALFGALTLAAVAGGVSAVAAASIPEQFTSQGRLSGMAFGFTAATAIFGGFAPLVADKLIDVTGWNGVPGAMIAVVAVCLIPVLWYLPETAPRATRR